ncbi:histone-lysine N-methyltransferase SETMAR [Trichonephila clavipes]|nr:histone-lysine N-methyltransferase SETMAR [Trichonephila clavipes]
MQVIRRLDTGERQSQIGAALNLATSAIRTILKNKEKILSSATATMTSFATRIIRSRNNDIEEMEKRLSIWTYDEIERNMPLNQDLEFYLFLYVYSIILFLYLHFDVKNASRTGRPIVENVDKITKIIEVFRHVNSRSIAQELKIDYKTVLNHWHIVGFKKKLDVWVPHQLTPKNMMDRISICEASAKRN